jgi:hypothetical protein
MEAKFEPLEKRIKNKEQLGTPFLTTKGMKKFWKR